MASEGGDGRKERDVASFDAADRFDELAFWHTSGRSAVARAALAPGASVLDVCCGTGASALPAARAVGPEGRVVGVDLSEPQLARARALAGRAGLANVEFVRGDLDRLDVGAAFDAVVCVFGIFFADDMACAARRLWGHVAPGGTLVITSWNATAMQPAMDVFTGLLREARPDWTPPEPHWRAIEHPAGMEAFLAAACPDAEWLRAEPVAQTHPLETPDAWWRVVMGSGLRGSVTVLDAPAQEALRRASAAALAARAVTAVDAGIVHGVARRPGW